MPYITPYIGFGNNIHVYVSGRVTKYPIREHQAGGIFQTTWDMMRNFLNPPLVHVPVKIQIGHQVHEAVSDTTGEFALKLPAPTIRDDTSWYTVSYTAGDISAKNEILIDTTGNEYGIISDIDDTLLKTNARSIMSVIAKTFTRNAQARKPVPGTPELYRALVSGTTGRATNPIFYISSSPVQLYNTFFAFLSAHEFPRGPLLLKSNRGFADVVMKRSRHQHKIDKITSVLETHPELSFILLGDSGQADAKIYKMIAERYPKRIRAVYIRHAGNTDATRVAIEQIKKLGIPALLAQDTEELYRHAREHTLITESVG